VRFADVRRLVIACLDAGSFDVEIREQMSEKNLLATGAVSVEEVKQKCSPEHALTPIATDTATEFQKAMTRKIRGTVAARTAATPASKAAPVKVRRFLKAGDQSRAICPHCRAMRDTVYQYRSVFLSKTKVSVPNVLVGVCQGCDQTIALPAQSTPRIKEAREREVKEQNARIPLELEDRLNMMAHSLDIRPEPFKGALCRYALSRIIRDKRFAQRVWKNAVSADAKGTPGGRVKFRSEASLPREAKAVALDAGIDDLSTILRGAILTVDVMLAAPRERAAMEHDLRLLAVGSGS